MPQGWTGTPPSGMTPGHCCWPRRHGGKRTSTCSGLAESAHKASFSSPSWDSFPDSTAEALPHHELHVWTFTFWVAQITYFISIKFFPHSGIPDDRDWVSSLRSTAESRNHRPTEIKWFYKDCFQAGELQTIKNSVSCSDSWSRYCERPGTVIWWLWCMEHADWG